MQGHSTLSQAVALLQTGQVISSHLHHKFDAGSALQWQWPYFLQCLCVPCSFKMKRLPHADNPFAAYLPEDAVALANMNGSNGASLTWAMSEGTAQGGQERGHASSTGSAKKCYLCIVKASACRQSLCSLCRGASRRYNNPGPGERVRWCQSHPVDVRGHSSGSSRKRPCFIHWFC